MFSLSDNQTLQIHSKFKNLAQTRKDSLFDQRKNDRFGKTLMEEKKKYTDRPSIKHLDRSNTPTKGRQYSDKLYQNAQKQRMKK